MLMYVKTFKPRSISQLAKEMNLYAYAYLFPDDLEETYGLSLETILDVVAGKIPDPTL